VSAVITSNSSFIGQNQTTRFSNAEVVLELTVVLETSIWFTVLSF